MLKCMLCDVLYFPFVNEWTRQYPLTMQCTEVAEDFGPLLENECSLEDLATFANETSPPIYSLCKSPSETTLTHMTSVQR